MSETGKQHFINAMKTIINKTRPLLLVLCAAVVFVTTYLLILPAVTLDEQEAAKQGGIDLPAASQQATDVTEAEGEGTEPADAEAKAEAEDAEPADGVLSFDGDGYSVQAAYDAKAGLPEDTELAAVEIAKDDDDYQGWYDEALKAVQDSKGGEQVTGLKFAKFYDISLLAGDEAIEPEAPVNVSISYDKALKAADADHVRIVHFGTDEEGELVPEVLDPKDVELELKKGKMSGTAFAAESFSVYGIVYTVDFHWEVDGKKFDFSIPGGGFVSLNELVKTLEIDKKADEEKTEHSFIEDVKSVEFSSPDLMWVGKVEKNTTVRDLKKENDLKAEYSIALTADDIDRINDTEVQAGDWALISLQPFRSEETLTVTMQNEETFVIKITDAQDDAIINNGVVQTIPNPKGTTIDLFDYWIDDNLKDSTARDAWPNNGNWYNYDTNSGQFVNNWTGLQLYGQGTNAGINANGSTNGHTLKFTPAQGGAVVNGALNTRSDDNNAPVDDPEDLTPGVNRWTHCATPRPGIVTDKLNDNGYPTLTDDPSMGTDGEDLDYLFDANYHAGKQRYGGVNNLLYVDPEGYYTYDSNDFRADYSNGGFTVTPQTEAVGDARGFWPFGTRKYWVGLHLQTDFSMPAAGKVLNPVGKNNDMTFEFQGDDDTWLYVDGVLVGDGGGIHNQTLINVNFRTGVVRVTGKKDAKPDYVTQYDKYQYLDNLYTAAEKFGDYEWVEAKDDDGNTLYHPNDPSDPRAGQPVMVFKQGSQHHFDMFYLERGGGESNLRIHYNLISTTDFSAHKSYHSLEGDANSRLHRNDFKFELIGFDNDEYDNGFKQAVMPANGTAGGDGTFESPKLTHSNSAPDGAGVPDGMTAHSSLIIGVTEDGNVNFGDVQLSASQVGKEYKYMVRELVPDDAVNADGVRWDAAKDEEKAEGGFHKVDKYGVDVTYDGKIYYFIGRVQLKEGSTSEYELKKIRKTDSTYETDDNETKFFSFVNGHVRPVTFKVVKKSNDTPQALLSGADFKLTRAKNVVEKDDQGHVTSSRWIERPTSTPKTGTTTNGTLSFEGLVEGHYILEETAAPDGYELGETYRWLLTLTKVDAADRIDLIPTLQKLDADGNVTGEDTIDFDNETNIAEHTILNAPKTIQLSLEKEWVGGAPENATADTAKFQLKRYRTYTKPGEVPMVDVYIRYASDYQSYANGGCNTGKHVRVPQHSKVRIGYSGFNASNNNYVYPWLSVYVGGTGPSHSGVLENGRYDAEYTVGTEEVCFWLYANHGNISPTDSRFNYTLEYVDGTGDTTPRPGETVKEEDTDFANQNIIWPAVGDTIPDDSTVWSHDFGAYPAAGTNQTYNVTETYSYYIEEITVPDGYTVSYDRMDGNDIDGSSDSETRIITNIKNTNVPVIKKWQWSEEDRGNVDHWDATFNLEYREILVSGEADPNAKHRWTPVLDEDQHQKSIKISSTGNQGTNTFEDLPMYKLHDNGSVYRIIYAVDEVEYNLYHSGQSTPFKTWSKSTSGHSDQHYAPDYEQDAGEGDEPEDASDWDEWYTIHLTNVESNKETLETIDLELEKIWENDSDNTISGDPSSYAKFQLKRYYHEEYLDYTQNNLDANDLVTVKLDLNNGDDPMELEVPRNAPVYIAAVVKPGENANVTFKKGGSSDTLTLAYDNSESDKQHFVATGTPFAAADNIEWQLNSGDVTALVGGKAGIRLASFDTKNGSYDITEDKADTGFNNSINEGGQQAGQEFELSDGNHWFKDWVDLPQVVEEITNTGNHIVRKTIVYSYYLEETDRNPSNYKAVFRNSTGEILGNGDNPIDFSTAITAENIETTTATVKKVWDDNNDKLELRPNSLTIDLYANGEKTSHSVTLTPETWESGETISDLPKYHNGEEIDYYWIEETMPDGYFLSDISKDGSVTTLTNSYSQYDTKTSYAGMKYWVDDDDQYGARPDDLVVTLQRRVSDNDSWEDYRNDPVWDKSEGSNTWTYTFGDLPVFDDHGNVYQYRAVETAPGGYSKAEDNTPTSYQFGQIEYYSKQEIRNRITPDNKLEWPLGSKIDLTFVAIKTTGNDPTIVWTSRTPTPQERSAIESLLNGRPDPLPGHNHHLQWVHGSTSVTDSHGTIYFEVGESKVTLSFSDQSVESQFIVGDFHKAGGTATTYEPGTTTFTNTLVKTGIKVIKVDDTDTNTKLPKAEFTLRRVKAESPFNYAEDESKAITKTTDNNGEAEFTDLAPGYYEVKETKLPAGYINDGEDAFYIHVVNGIATMVVKNGDSWQTVDTADDGKFTYTPAGQTTVASVTVTNKPGAQLPSSGGPGTTWIYLIGSILLICCSTLLVARRRVRKMS